MGRRRDRSAPWVTEEPMGSTPTLPAVISRTPAPTTDRKMLVVGIAALVALVLGVVARRTAVTAAEVDVFRWLNDAPDAVGRPVWVVMQLGSFWGAIAVAALVMGLLRGWRGAIVGMVTTLTAWLVAIMAKAWVERGRPADYLHGIHFRFVHLETGNGYPSGHAAVAFAV